MDIINILKDELGIKRTQAETAVKLIDEGNTIPFIARYPEKPLKFLFFFRANTDRKSVV